MQDEATPDEQLRAGQADARVSAQAPARLRLGYSPCPNDTFIFYALAHGLVNDGRQPEVSFDIRLEDVETLNRAADQGELDVAKVSYHAYGYLTDRFVMLRAGGALGSGVGPLIVTRDPLTDLAGRRIAIPGGRTTANLLLRLSQPAAELVELRYDRIMPAVAAGEVDAGLIIHESRFTYPEHGLRCFLDLGAWWERTTGALVPLGGIVARRDLGDDVLHRLQAMLRSSLVYAWEDPTRTHPYVAANAQEMDPSVRQRHIDLYVNGYSMDVGADGERAAALLLGRAAEQGLFRPWREPLFLDAGDRPPGA
ncbi:MAG TPA: 1,4-dihydroxy-6-naphthoate synthase [Trueperaceae bacterium]|nr:1,4-dihydroxy-6-naphthoate synthase [Trueperaceae bacterium]